MPQCWIVPGILSSELYYDARLTSLMWPSTIEIARGRFGALRLDDSGRIPAIPDGRVLFHGGPLPDLWHGPVALLHDQLRTHSYTISSWGYDWRRRAAEVGNDLAADILARVPAGDTVTLVCHSLGGIVARFAWRSLGAIGAHGLVRRIITLGTPHQGCYAPVSLWSADDDSLAQIHSLNLWASGLAAPTALGFGVRYWTVDEIVVLTQTWPALYDLLPVIGAPAWSADHDMPRLYDVLSWDRSGRLSQRQLNRSRSDTGPSLLDPDTMPPPHVLTTVSGIGWRTPTGLLDWPLLGSPRALGETQDGDGVVPRSSAEVRASAPYYLIARHVDLPAAAAANGRLASWVLAERPPLDPAPPPVRIPDIIPPLLTVPPMVASFGGSVGASSCPGGRCSC